MDESNANNVYLTNCDISGNATEAFCLDTKLHCFLCLRDILIGNSNYGSFENTPCPTIKVEEESLPLETFSLHSICRYLKINFKHVFTSEHSRIFGGETGKSLEDAASNLTVKLCNLCYKIVVKLSNLCIELELLKMKVEHCLKSFNGVLKDSEKGIDYVHYLQRMTTSTLAEGIHLEVADLLRKEMKRKCLLKINRSLPKVMLTKDSLIQQASNKISFEDSVVTPTKHRKIFTITVTPYNSSLFNTETNAPIDLPNAGNDRRRRRRKQLRVSKSVEPVCTKKKKTLLNEPKVPTELNPSYVSCNYCCPPTPVRKGDKTKHHITYHLNYYFGSSKLPNLSTDEFKEYCEHVVKFEVLSGQIQTDSCDNPVRKCPFCPYTSAAQIRNMYNHVCIHHKDILAEKLDQLQKNTTLLELKAIQLPSSSFPMDYRFKCAYCGQKFGSQFGLRKHQKLRCKNHKSSKFSTSNQLAAYITCDICKVTFSSVKNLQRHKVRAHRELYQQNMKYSEISVSASNTPSSSLISTGAECVEVENVISVQETFFDESVDSASTHHEQNEYDRNETKKESNCIIGEVATNDSTKNNSFINDLGIISEDILD